jgi:alanyl-tRNA synthetase
MSSEKVRKLFLRFFEERGHKVALSYSLIPDDPSVLLTTAGMQQFKRYFTGELDPLKDFGSKNTVSIQKCFRTSDIDEVGDESHLTFFEMLGHFSFGEYFKKETIEWTFELLTKTFGINPERISATVFEGDTDVPFDKESFGEWSKLLPKERIGKGSRAAGNFWGPAGIEGPCGACNEVYVDGVEVATLVFMEYYCHSDRKLKQLVQKGVDVGWGFERLVAILQGTRNVFEIDLLQPIVSKIRERVPQLNEKNQRIFTDHIRAGVFLAADGLRPSNKEAGYILRRHLRRLLAYQIKYDVHSDIFPTVVKIITEKYKSFYPELKKEKEILKVFEDERFRFQKTLCQGILEIERCHSRNEKIDAQKAFYLYETFGLHFELIKELAPKNLIEDLKKEDFDKEFEKHQEISKAGAEKKFGGHGLILDTGELKAGNPEELKKVTRLHTATHLLHQALRDVLGDSARQMGSDVNAERTRFDFTFPRKLTPEEIKKIENIINQKISEDLPVSFKELPKEEAEKTGALHFFKLKYPEQVKIYFIGDSFETAYSREFCGGPHVTHTGEIGEFKIIKEEAVAAGVRRIRAASFMLK